MEEREVKAIPRYRIEEFKEETTQKLILAYSKDYISIDEFEERINTIEHSNSMEEIRQTTQDLPREELAEKNTSLQPPHCLAINILGKKHVDGSVVVKEYGGVKSILGSTIIDLRTIETSNAYIYLLIPTYLSDVKIIVPKDMKIINKLDGILSDVTKRLILLIQRKSIFLKYPERSFLVL